VASALALPTLWGGSVACLAFGRAGCLSVLSLNLSGEFSDSARSGWGEAPQQARVNGADRDNRLPAVQHRASVSGADSQRQCHETSL
jgi:hypothetical protein